MKVDNIVSIAGPREASRMRRLMGMPFAKKFLLDQEHIFKQCTKKVIDNLDRLSATHDGRVDVALQFMKYSFDLLSKGSLGTDLIDSRICVWGIFQRSCHSAWRE